MYHYRFYSIERRTPTHDVYTIVSRVYIWLLLPCKCYILIYIIITFFYEYSFDSLLYNECII